MDFFQICVREIERGPNKGKSEIFPDFVVGRSKDLMVRGRSFYAIWDENTNLWSTDEYDVQRIVDDKLRSYAKDKEINHVKYMKSFGTNGWNQFRRFMSQISDNSHQLDESLTFANTDVKKTDYVSRRLPYNLAPGDIGAWDELIGVLYSSQEREKIEWAIGAVVSGESKTIQKFLVLYGPAGTGKSTVLNIIQKLFDGYTTSFEAKALGGSNNSFSTEVFKANPLVALQHDGDLSKIEDNTKLNSIISHEDMTMNEKYKPAFTAKVNAFLFMGTNQPVKISDAKSGIIRRLIDVHPSGEKLAPRHYHNLMSKIDFELGAIAQHCLDVYRARGKNYYNAYRPLEMMLQTDIFFNFIEANYDIFKEQNGTTLKQAYALYKEYCADTGIERPLPQYKVREELRNYFQDFQDRGIVDQTTVRSYYSGFTAHPFKTPVDDDEGNAFSLVMDESTSIFDLEYADCPAQYAKEGDIPQTRWANVKTTLAEIDTSRVHFVQTPENLIVIDFDLEDENGDKSLERNLAAASAWPPTYGELSKSGSAVHLHYLWTGGEDVSRLDPHYDDGIEVKVFTGNSSLRRRLSRANNVPIAELNSGLPLKEKKVLTSQTIQSEKGVREMIARNLRKEIHPGTKSSVDFIYRILEDAHLSGMVYDVSDLQNKIMAFANNSTNQPLLALKVVRRMKFKSEEGSQIPLQPSEKPVEERYAFFDVEVYPNLFIVCWKFQGDSTVVRMINPSPQEVERLFQFKLIGFNNRRYDNHILYGRYMGFDNEQLYKLSQKIIDGSVGAMFGEAYNISFADIYDFTSRKQGLKKYQIELGIPHKEMDIPWDQPVPENRWKDVEDYCANDVESTEATFESRASDWAARLILAELSGLSANHTTQKHTAAIIFGGDRNPQRDFVYTNLAKEFPGYVFDRGQSTYRGETPGEGGYVYDEPGIYSDVALLDVASMHPTSIEQLGVFGDYTAKYSELKEARLAIKAKDYDRARTLLGGRLSPYLGSDQDSTALSDALKIALNIVYGLTSAKFDNPFRDIRNVDNIVAKRGALFMIDLKHFLQERGYTVAHIKTDSVKIPNATPEIIQEVMLFGEKYGYTFEYNPDKDQYSKLALVNAAVYIAKKDHCAENSWIAVGAQFQHPYVFKTLFSGEVVEFKDLCETKQVSKGAMQLDFDSTKPMAFTDIADKLHFVGRTGQFVPVKEGFGGGILYRVMDDKTYAVAGTKGYLWVESHVAEKLPREAIDMSYFDRLVDEARNTIGKFGDFETFVS
jgi:energy-coupling factor transporter ATP-binding protein EcfA2